MRDLWRMLVLARREVMLERRQTGSRRHPQELAAPRQAQVHLMLQPQRRVGAVDLRVQVDAVRVVQQVGEGGARGLAVTGEGEGEDEGPVP
jgi:hypothetical protein